MSVPTEVAELIDGARLSAHLATTVDDRPHVAPVWYVYDDGTLSVLTGGKKLRNVERNPRVAVSIERYDEDGVDWAVQLLGTATVVDDDDRYEAVAERMDAKYAGSYGTDVTESDGTETDGGHGDGTETTGGGEDEYGTNSGGEDETGTTEDESGESEETDEVGALVDIEVGSATGQRY